MPIGYCHYCRFNNAVLVSNTIHKYKFGIYCELYQGVLFNDMIALLYPIILCLLHSHSSMHHIYVELDELLKKIIMYDVFSTRNHQNFEHFVGIVDNEMIYFSNYE